MTFHYEEDPNTKDFAARYPFHHEQMLMPIIDIVDDEFTHYCTGINICLDELAQEGDKDAHQLLTSQLYMLMSAQGITTMGNIAKLILKCMDTFCAKKNWNSHGASVHSVICQLASILSQMPAASVNELNHNFRLKVVHHNSLFFYSCDQNPFSVCNQKTKEKSGFSKVGVSTQCQPVMNL